MNNKKYFNDENKQAVYVKRLNYKESLGIKEHSRA
jgi:hypothetical protein